MAGAPQALDETALAVAPQADLDVTLLLRAARQAREEIDNALANGRE
jgi:hypothetical protein